MIVHLKADEVHLTPLPPDERRHGDAVTAYGPLFSSGDGTVEVGFWEFSGEQWIAPRGDVHEIVVVLLSGTLELECDGERCFLEEGDIAIYDCPISGKSFHSPGAKAAYVVRYRAASA